jgi:hypothetical protein
MVKLAYLVLDDYLPVIHLFAEEQRARPCDSSDGGMSTICAPEPIR